MEYNSGQIPGTERTYENLETTLHDIYKAMMPFALTGEAEDYIYQRKVSELTHDFAKGFGVRLPTERSRARMQSLVTDKSSLSCKDAYDLVFSLSDYVPKESHELDVPRLKSSQTEALKGMIDRYCSHGFLRKQNDRLYWTEKAEQPLISHLMS